MKTTNSLLLVGAAALGFTLTTASAGDIAASPRFHQTLNERIRVASPDTSPNLVSNTYPGNPAKWGFTVPSAAPTGTTLNLVSGNYAGAASKHPYPPPMRFEIAPLVEKGKAGNTCEMDCCAKK